MSEDSDMASERVDIAALRSRVETFESPIEAAIREKYGSYTNLTTEQSEMIIRGTPVMRFSLLEVFDSYLSNDSWVQDRLPKTVDYLFDLKLQLYYLTEIELGIYNQLYHSPINADPSLADSPRLLLIRLSLDQNLIGKSRIFWERVMNLVYYLEKGEDLETKKSKKKAFFNLVEDLDRWRWLAPYGHALTKYDDAFRTPEFHKHSVLRGQLMGTREIDPNELLDLANRAIEILDNIRSVIRDGRPQSYSDLHLDDSNEIRSEYLVPNHQNAHGPDEESTPAQGA